ncbi:MAG: hypothetical protein HC880_19770 [Bacteroidia bacterium]|nr:hypothetical protein [Bacteroidia bacterium]
MEYWIYKYLVLTALGLSLGSMPAPAQVQKERKITKSFPVSQVTTLSIYNKYGKVHINTNSPSEIKVEVTIVAQASSAEKAQSLAESIEIQITGGTNIILKSEGGPTSRFGIPMNNSRKTDYEINYLVSMPKTVALTLKNSFGDVYLADHQSKLNLNVGYGSLKTARISGLEDKYIKVSFGSAVHRLYSAG